MADDLRVAKGPSVVSDRVLAASIDPAKAGGLGSRVPEAADVGKNDPAAKSGSLTDA
jgi:hypothetical protein